MRARWTTEILDFLQQSNISAKNLKRLQVLEAEAIEAAIEDVAELASLVRQIADACPRKRKRWKRLKHQHWELFKRALEAGLLEYQEGEFPRVPTDEPIDDEAVYGIWIEPRYYEVEPTLEEIRLASDETMPFWC